MKIAVVVGTRPEIIKMSPIIRELQVRNLDYVFIHTGQHYSYNLDKVFFEELELPLPNYNLDVGSGSHAKQTANIMIRTEDLLTMLKPDVVLVEGDTNTVLGVALAAVKLHIKVGHVEAGLRSRDKRMPEEINRVLTDHCSDHLFAPTESAKRNLLSENISEWGISVTGNTVVDAVGQNLGVAQKHRSLHSRYKLREYYLLTLHRPENVDNKDRFESILQGVKKLAEDIPVVYPIHLRACKMLNEYRISADGLSIIEPVGYLEFLQLEYRAKLILTDSGGVQEEACILGVPCVTLRDSTERPETIEVGANVLAGANPAKIVDCVKGMINRRNKWANPFGDGQAGKRIVDILTGDIGG